ncbi:MAG: hypothetical protein JJU11_05860 [Candidatus Sumerlaeia bacterium]|nr:hypothetical protein [Candidatus Sumerlaeia bacterium]
MTDQKKGPEPFRHEIPANEESDLSAFLGELGEDAGEPAAATPPQKNTKESAVPTEPPPAPTDAEQPAKPEAPMSRYDQIRNTRGVSMEKEDLELFSEFSKVIGKIHAAQQTIEGLRDAHPELVPERHFNTWISNLKETHMVMMKEFYALRNGLKEKKYDKRCICIKCNTVFMVPLPADGICDECRADRRA